MSLYFAVTYYVRILVVFINVVLVFGNIGASIENGLHIILGYVMSTAQLISRN